MHWWPRHTPSTGSFGPKWRDDVVARRRLPCGVQGPGEMTMWVGLRSSTCVDGHLVVAEDLASSAPGVDLAQLLDEVVGEGVVVIDQDDHLRDILVALWCPINV